MSGAGLVRRAHAFAAERHRGQVRKGDGRPFISHPSAVARLLKRHGMPEEVVAAGFLHDVLEDTPTPADELERRFGAKVAALVREVTEPDKSHPWEFRKEAYLAHLRRASREALAISCADKLHNTSSLIAAYRREGPEVFDRFSRGVEEKLAYHRRVYGQIRRSWPGCPLLGPLERAVRELEGIVGTYHRSLPREVEAKFVPRDASVVRALSRLRELGPFRRAASRKERQRNTYWDTAGWRIHRGRAALKARQVGARCELTFKREISYRRGVSERIEISRSVRLRDLPRILAGDPAAEPVRHARKIVGRAPLKEVLTLLTDRQKRVFARGKERIELDVDRVTVRRPRGAQRGRGGGVHTPGLPLLSPASGAVLGRYTEVELENLGASPERFAGALAELRRRFGSRLRPSRLSKYEIGLRMIRRKG